MRSHMDSRCGEGRRALLSSPFPTSPLLTACLVALWLMLPGRSAAQNHEKGTWSWVNAGQWDEIVNNKLESGGGTHMTLVRGTADSSWLAHWHHGYQARLWLAKPMDDEGKGVAVPCNLLDLFCGAQTTMADGKLLAVGGTIVGVTGEDQHARFDPTAYYQGYGTTNPWTAGWLPADSTEMGRWYSTVTTLGDGKSLTVAGAQWMNLVMFGGAKSQGPTVESGLFNLGRHEKWDPDPTPASPRPFARHGHASVYYNGFTLIHGGEADTTMSTLWALFGEDTDNGRSWRWIQQSMNNASGLPSARSRHTAVNLNDSMFVFGGKGTGSSVFGDLWLCRLSPRTNQATWEQLSTTGAPPPSARYGHTAVLARMDRDPAEMVIYGGLNENGHVDDDVYVLTIPRGGGGPFTWRKLTFNPSGPGPREGHSAVLTNIATVAPHPHRIVVFGGRKSSGPNGGVVNDAWELRQTEDAMGVAGEWQWLNNNSLPVVNSPPTARYRHAAAYDSEWGRMIMFGGDTNGEASGGYSQDLYELDVIPNNPVWNSVTATGMPEARWGHTLVFDSRPIQAMVPELYDPSVGSKGDWAQFPIGSKWLPYYPFMFALQDGKVFFAGNGPEHASLVNSWVYLPATGQAWSNSTSSGFLGGSAVIFPNHGTGQDTVMKCGGDDDVSVAPGEYKQTASARISSGGATTWIDHTIANPLPESRTYHNLTLLPDGRAVVTGGRQNIDGGAFTRIARMWDPATRTWGTDLALDLEDRGYHSSALLLPDARVICAGGPPAPITDLRASIFTPPYLYAADGQLATRPTILTRPTYTVHYGEPFYMTVSSAPSESIRIVSVVRPGAATHAFDQNQRCLKLPFTRVYGFRAVVPSNKHVLPPGDYMLFAVRSGVTGVPSVAKWIRVDSELGGDDDEEPGTVADLEFGAYNEYMGYLAWTVPGDDGFGPGAPTSYELRYSTNPINTGNWDSASVISSGVSAPKGYVQVVVVNCTEGYFAVRIADEKPNLSGVSNNATGSCSGGGMGESARRADPGRFGAQPASLIGAPDRSSTTTLWLPQLETTNAGYTITVVNSGEQAIRLDSLSLFVGRETEGSLDYCSGNQILRGTRVRPARVSSSRAGDVTASFSGGSANSYATSDGEIITLHLPPGSGATDLLLEVAAPDGDAPPSGRLAIEKVGPGGWVPHSTHIPLRDEHAWVVEGVPSESLRVVVTGQHVLRALDLLVPGPGSAVENVQSSYLEHSRLGEISAAPGPGDELVLQPGEQLVVSFAEGSEGAGKVRPMLAIGSSLHGAPAADAARVQGPPLPRAFSLSQNKPNPFGDGTVIRFALPVASKMELDVFDLHGRRVTTLTAQEWPAGDHTVTWDGRDANGRRVGPGVYLYRMSAGSFRASRKLAVLP